MSKRRQIIAIVSGIVVLLAVIIGLILFFQPKTFPLSAEYYSDQPDFQIVSVDTIKDLIAEHKSFAVFAYQPACRTSEDFEQVLKDFSTEHNVVFLKTPFAELKTAALIPDLKYYPSLILYRDGKLVTFLRADSDEDLKIYQNADDFTAWWNRYVRER